VQREHDDRAHSGVTGKKSLSWRGVSECFDHERWNAQARIACNGHVTLRQRVRPSNISSRASPPARAAGLQPAAVAGRSLGPNTALAPLSSVVCPDCERAHLAAADVHRSPHHNGHRVPSGAAGAGEARGTPCTAHRLTDVPLEPATRACHSITLSLHTYTLLAFCCVVAMLACSDLLNGVHSVVHVRATTMTLCAQPHTAFRMVASGHRSDHGFHTMPIPLMCPQWYSPRRCEKAWYAGESTQTCMPHTQALMCAHACSVTQHAVGHSLTPMIDTLATRTCVARAGADQGRSVVLSRRRYSSALSSSRT